VVLTQNVDGLHKDAGSTNVIEIHGTVRRLRCVRCAHREERADWAGLRIPPVCPSCGRAVRPDVVLFEESLPQKALRRLAHERNRGYDLVFSIGTTSGFPYIRQPVVTAAMMGIPTVEINPGFTEVSHLVVHRFANGAADTLDQLASALTASEEA
jgi:NAD-dependent deacetylase